MTPERNFSMNINSRSLLRKTVLLWLVAVIVISLQTWVGDATIYAQDVEAPRKAMHEAILTQRLPDGRTWADWGALSMQKRVGVVYMAETIRRATQWRIGTVYKLIDTVFLFIALLALFAYLRRWVSDYSALVGMLYFSAVLPLTYFLHFFHPWDRLQLCLWLLLLWLAEARRFAWLAVLLPLSVVVKFDTLLFPAFYLLLHWKRDGRGRVLIESAALMAIAWGVNHALGQIFADPAEGSRFELTSVMAKVQGNFDKFVAMNLRYPPLLVHGLPLALACIGWRRQPRFVILSSLFGFAMLLIYVLLTNFEEVRTHMMVLVLLLPAALMTLERLLLDKVPVAQPEGGEGVTRDIAKQGQGRT